MSENTYKVTAHCKNCGFHGEVEIEKGIKLEQADCPTCGCKCLSRRRRV